jgi:hypothetical protein
MTNPSHILPVAGAQVKTPVRIAVKMPKLQPCFREASAVVPRRET